MNRLVLLLAIGSTALAACTKELEAPTNPGVCWHMAPLPDGHVRFNVVARNAPTVEKCAVALEDMRQRFLGLGGNQEEIVGAYQGQFLFLGTRGVFISQRLNGARYPLLVPTGDGRLAKPGVMPVQ